MKLLFHLETKSNIDAVLAAAYAFSPTYAFKHIGNGTLETTIDAAIEFTDAQWAIVTSSTYEVSLVAPTNATPAPVSPPVAASTGL